MALNFLKRKKTSQKNVLLYHNPYIKKKSKNDFASCTEDSSGSVVTDCSCRSRPDVLQEVLQQKQPACKKLKVVKESSETLDEIGSLFAERNVTEQNWDKVKERIEKLMFEISDLFNSDNYIKRRSDTMIEPHGDKENNPKPQELSSQTIPENSCSNPKKLQTNESSKLPLDIQELQTVSAMAKRLSAHSKVKNQSLQSDK